MLSGWAGGWAPVQDSSPRDPKSPVKTLQIAVQPRWPADLEGNPKKQKTHSRTESELTLRPPPHQRRAYAYAMWAHSESFPLAAWRSRGWAAESIFHLTLHTAGLRLAPVLICKKGSICIHQDCLGSQEGLGLFQSQQTKRGGERGGHARGCQAGRQEPGRTEAIGMAGETQSSSNHRLQGWREHSPPNRRLGTQRSLEQEIPPRTPINWPHFIDGKTEAQREDRIF